MHSGQTMLVIAAFVLLSTLTLSINSTMITSSNLGLEMEVNLNALSLGQSLLDEMLNKDFDENTTGGRRINVEAKASTILGPDAGEVITGADIYPYKSKKIFDDFDDYNGYERAANDSILGIFTIKAEVKYADENTPDNNSLAKTFQKRATITVTHPNMTKDLRVANDTTVLPVVLKDLWVYRRFF